MVSTSQEETLLVDQIGTIEELEERNTLLERQLEEYGKYVQTTPEGSVIIGRPTGGKIHITPESTLRVSPNAAFDCNQAWYYIEKNRVCAAKEVLLDALPVDTTYYRTHLYLGIICTIEQSFSEAVEHLNKAIIYAPEDPNERKVVLLMAALANKGNGNRTRAQSLLDEALTLDPKYGLAKRAREKIDQVTRVPLGHATMVVPGVASD